MMIFLSTYAAFFLKSDRIVKVEFFKKAKKIKVQKKMTFLMDKLFSKKTSFIAYQNFIQDKGYWSFLGAYSGFLSESSKIHVYMHFGQ